MLRLKYGSILSLTVSCLLSSQLAVADELIFQSPALTAKPNRCISLHQGQVCYQSVVFNWQLAQPGNYCLYQQASKTPLQCWQATEHASYQYEFESNMSLSFYLRETTSQVMIGKTQVTVAWVYKTKRNSSSGWRLF